MGSPVHRGPSFMFDAFISILTNILSSDIFQPFFTFLWTYCILSFVYKLIRGSYGFN